MFFTKGFVVLDIDYRALVIVWAEGTLSFRNRSQLLQDSFFQTHNRREELSGPWPRQVRRTSQVTDEPMTSRTLSQLSLPTQQCWKGDLGVGARDL